MLLLTAGPDVSRERGIFLFNPWFFLLSFFPCLSFSFYHNPSPILFHFGLHPDQRIMAKKEIRRLKKDSNKSCTYFMIWENTHWGLSLFLLFLSELYDILIYLLGCVCIIRNVLCRSPGIKTSEKQEAMIDFEITTVEKKDHSKV